MPLNHRDTLLLLLVIIIIQWWFVSRRPATVLYREPYSANSLITLTNVIAKPGLFYQLTRFEIDIWIEQLLNPLLEKIIYPRNYELWNDINALDIQFNRTRSCQIGIAERLFRWNVIMSGCEFRYLAWISDQHISTVHRDFYHICTVVLHQLSNRYLYHPAPNSWEYNALKGNGNFSLFPNVVYAADVVKIRIREPSRNQRVYFDGHHWEHNVGFWCACDYQGRVRIVFGEEPGSRNDAAIYALSDMYGNEQSYLDATSQILFDGIYSNLGHPFLCPFTGHHGHVVNRMERIFNGYQRRARVIIENVFGVTKNRFQIINTTYKLSLRKIGIVVRCCFLLNNIIIENQAPIRV